MLAEVVGQPQGVQCLRRIADRQSSSALLLVGDEGVGRQFATRHLAKELFCTGTRSVDCQCYDCVQLDEGTHPDFLVIRPAENKDIEVDQIRELIVHASEFPSVAPLRLFLIDGADVMNTAAANALLKTLEEPQSSTRLVLTAVRKGGVLPTVRSRCTEVRFHLLPETFILSRVSQHVTDDAKALVYARMGEGSVGRAIQYCGSGRLALRDRVFSLLGAGIRRDLPAVFSIASNLEKDLATALRFLDQIVRDLHSVRFLPDRLINLDLLEPLTDMRSKVDPPSLHQLSWGLRALAARRTVSLNLCFQVQALFVASFFGA